MGCKHGQSLYPLFYQNRWQKSNEADKYCPMERVFGQVWQHYIYKRWMAYVAANDLTPCSLYELRHTFVSIAQSLPEGQLRQLVGSLPTQYH